MRFLSIAKIRQSGVTTAARAQIHRTRGEWSGWILCYKVINAVNKVNKVMSVNLANCFSYKITNKFTYSLFFRIVSCSWFVVFVQLALLGRDCGDFVVGEPFVIKILNQRLRRFVVGGAALHITNISANSKLNKLNGRYISSSYQREYNNFALLNYSSYLNY